MRKESGGMGLKQFKAHANERRLQLIQEAVNSRHLAKYLVKYFLGYYSKYIEIEPMKEPKATIILTYYNQLT